jgi:hypothetical protein
MTITITTTLMIMMLMGMMKIMQWLNGQVQSARGGVASVPDPDPQSQHPQGTSECSQEASGDHSADHFLVDEPACWIALLRDQRVTLHGPMRSCPSPL